MNKIMIFALVCLCFWGSSAHSKGFFEREIEEENKSDSTSQGFVLSADSGARCKDSKECEGYCVYPLDARDDIALSHARYLMEIGEPTEGRCSMNAVKEITKCVIIVEHGFIKGEVCP
jgi:hypothetical protein